MALRIHACVLLALLSIAALEPASLRKLMEDSTMILNRMVPFLLVGSLWAGSTAAQVDDTHRGFWISFGAGGGWTGEDRSATTYFRMGGTPNSKVHFGGQVLHWWQDDDFEHSSVTATFSVYPFYGAGGRPSLFREFFLKSGFGVATAECHGHDESGIGLNLGTGFDLRLNRNFFVTPNLDLAVDFFDDSTQTAFLFSLGLSWH